MDRAGNAARVASLVCEFRSTLQHRPVGVGGCAHPRRRHLRRTQPEHAISCVSAGSILRNLDPARFEVVAVGITPEGSWVLTDASPESLAITDRQLPEVSGTSGTALATAADPAPARAVVVAGARRGEVRPPSTWSSRSCTGPTARTDHPGAAGAGRCALCRRRGVRQRGGDGQEFTKKLLAAEGLPIGDHVVLPRARPRQP